MRDRVYFTEEEGDRNDSNSDAGSGEEIRGRNYRDVGAPEADSSDDDVDDPVDAAGRGTRGVRPPRDSFIPDDDISGQTERATVRHALERLAVGSEGREGNDGNDAGPPRADHPRQLDPLPEHRPLALASKFFHWLFHTAEQTRSITLERETFRSPITSST